MTAERFGVSFASFQKRSVGPVSPLYAIALAPSSITKPTASIVWFTWTGVTRRPPRSKATSAATSRKTSVGPWSVGMREKSGQRRSLKKCSRSVAIVSGIPTISIGGPPADSGCPPPSRGPARGRGADD